MKIPVQKMKIPVQKRLKGAVGRVAALAGVFARDFRSKMVIVAFHRINDELPEDGLTLSSARFEKFCEFFRDHFRVVPLSEQVAACSAGRDMGGTLSITFDDGYRDNFEVAAPILRKLKLPATFFVTTGFIGTRIVAPWDRHLAQQPGWMDWDQLRTLVAQGFEIGCHTETHVDLGVVDATTAWSEIEASRTKLNEQLGQPVRLFAYPFGCRYNLSVESRELVLRAGFLCCLSGDGGPNARTADPFNLNRIVIGQGFVSPNQFGLDLLLGRV